MSIQSNPDDLDLMEKLALSLLSHSGGSQAFKPRLLAGKIPEHLPLEVPIPEQSRVLGTLVRSETQVEIVLESDLTSEDVFSFYRTYLTAQVWHEQEDLWPLHGRGFTHRGFSSHIRSRTSLTFCQGSGGAGLTLNILQTENATLRLKLSLDQTMYPCTNPAQRQRQKSLQSMLTPLIPPQDAQQHGMSGSSSSEEARSTTTLTTHLAIDALAAHYAEQLIQAGWARAEAGTSGPLLWHRWQFTSEEQEPCNCLFFILKTPEKPDNYFLFIRVSWSNLENDQGPTSWTMGFTSA